MTTEADRIVAGLLSRVTAYCDAHGISERDFGLRVGGTHKLISRVRSGTFSGRTLRKIEEALNTAPPPSRRSTPPAQASA